IGFCKGDILVVDASSRAISSGETDARLLRTLHEKGVSLYHCASLHAKVLLLDDVAVISSGNMSNSSVGLVEAGVMTDHSSTVAGVASFIEQILVQSNKLRAKDIDTLCNIKVVRKGGRLKGMRQQRRPKITRLGNRTWLVGIRELVKPPSRDEQRFIDRAINVLRSQMKNPEETAWVRWSSKARFARECRQGDALIQIWRSSNAQRPTSVFRTSPVLLKQ